MTKSRGSEWVSLRRAADILGVHPATVRNWADSGKIRHRRTAGRHRRFHMDDLRGFVDGDSGGGMEAQELQLVIHNALGQARMQASNDKLQSEAWYQAMSEETRQYMRDLGRRVLQAIRGYVAGGAHEDKLGVAALLGEEYAARLREDGVKLSHAMRGFNFFGDFVVNAILVWSELGPPSNTAEWSKALRQVSAFMNACQLAIIEAYEAD